MKFNKITTACLMAALSFGVAPTQAQNDEPIVLQEIIVTSSKRETTLQDLGITVSVVTAETIQQAHIQDLIDLQSVVPALRVSQQQTTANANFKIRTFGNGANNPGIEPSVGVFVDGVYRSRVGAAINDLPRLDRVEVLSGPQSTLFGKNASAGVISIVTPLPSGDTGGYVSGSVGNQGAVLAKGLYEGRLSENATFDVSGSVNQRDGVFENAGGAKDLNDRDRFSVRGQLHYTPSEKSSWRILADHSEIKEACCAAVNVSSEPETTAAIQSLGGQFSPNNPETETAFTNVDSVNNIENSGLSAQFDHEFENLKFTSISSYRNSSTSDQGDGDFAGVDLIGEIRNSADVDTFTQEFRMLSTTGGRFGWLVGGFYFNESVNGFAEAEFGTAFRPFIQAQLTAGGFPLPLGAVEAGLGLPIGSFYQAGTGTRENFTLDNESYSLFSELEYALTDSLVGTIGLNYTRDQKEFSIQQDLTDVRSLIELPGLLGVIPSIIPNSVDIPNAIESNETEDDELTYSARLQWSVTDNINIYGSYATGFKASSINLSRDSAPNEADFARLQAAGIAGPNSFAGTRIADPETVDVFEIGVKALFNNGAINVSVFDQTLDDFQDQIFTSSRAILSNAGESNSKGIDFDISYLPTDSLLFTLKGTLIDGTITDPFGTGSSDSFSEDDINVSFSAQYDFSIYGVEAFLRGDYQYEKGVPFFSGALPLDIAPNEINTINLSTGVVLSNGVRMTLWARNLNDDFYLLNAFPTTVIPGSISGFRNEPRSFGLTVRKDF